MSEVSKKRKLTAITIVCNGRRDQAFVYMKSTKLSYDELAEIFKWLIAAPKGSTFTVG